MKVAIFLNSGNQCTRIICADKIICADGGLNFCPLKPDYVIGDFDSATTVPDGVKKIVYDSHKNFTDGEAAVLFAKELGADEIDFYGVLGGRYDHTLGNFNIMSLANGLDMKPIARENGLDIYYASAKDKSISFSAKKQDLVSVIPHGGDALISSYENLEYELINLTLTVNDSRGISNLATGGIVKLFIADGNVLVFHYFKD